jgi:DNA processing protein
MSETRYWIGLSLVPDVGPVMSKKLIAEMGSPENISSAGMKDLLAVRGLGKQKAENIKNFRLWDFIEKQLTLGEKKGIRVVVYRDEGYPQVLKEIEGAPIVLYYEGRVSSR